jgi:hypothetical protein
VTQEVRHLMSRGWQSGCWFAGNMSMLILLIFVVTCEMW